jgi:hypothetical protein
VPGDPRIRAADADRDRATALLTEHHAAGRLTAEEFHDRMEKAMDAKTLGEIDELMTDLPAIDLYQLPDATLRRPPPRRGQSLLPAESLLPGESLSPAESGRGELEGLSAEATAVAAWAAVATALVAIGVITAVVIGALVPLWAVVVLPAAAVAWIWFLIRRSQR